MHNVCTKDVERYALRVLLLHVKGATSYENICTVDVHILPNHSIITVPNVFETFREAAIQLGLLNDDKEWDRCLTDAEFDQMPVALQSLFASILVHCKPTDCLKLWDKHKKYFYDDRDWVANQERYNYLAYFKIE